MLAFCVVFDLRLCWLVRDCLEGTSTWQLLGVAKLPFHEALGRPSLALPAKLSDIVKNVFISLHSSKEHFPRMLHTFYIKAP